MMRMTTMQQLNEDASEKCSEGLTKLLERPASVKFSNLALKSVSKLTQIVGTDTLVAGVYIPLTGDIRGSSLLMFTQEDAFQVSDLLVRREPGTTRKLAPIDQAALKEMGNTVVGGYISIFSNHLQLKMVVNVPSYCCDIYGAVVSQMITKTEQSADRALVAQIEFTFAPLMITGYFVCVIYGGQQMDAMVRALEWEGAV
jgi:chemotaxis protein CheY-P-specific phosphatase CheC